MLRLTYYVTDKAHLWRNSNNIMQWCRQNHYITIDDQDKWLERIKEPDIQMFTVSKTDPQTLQLNKFYVCSEDEVGVVGLTSISTAHRTAEFSIYIAPEHQGNGYGKEALKLLLDYGFYNLDLAVIWGDVFEGNPALPKFLEMGFKEEGIFRSRYYKNGKRINSTAISILREEWDDQLPKE